MDETRLEEGAAVLGAERAGVPFAPSARSPIVGLPGAPSDTRPVYAFNQPQWKALQERSVSRASWSRGCRSPPGGEQVGAAPTSHERGRSADAYWKPSRRGFSIIPSAGLTVTRRGSRPVPRRTRRLLRCKAAPDVRRDGATILTAAVRAEMRQLVLVEGWRIETVARRYGLHHSLVRRALCDGGIADGSAGYAVRAPGAKAVPRSYGPTR
jgi:transposase-like protein